MFHPIRELQIDLQILKPSLEFILGCGMEGHVLSIETCVFNHTAE